jgi:hypothetical protein
MGKLLTLTCGQIVLLVVNIICVDFAGLTVIFPLLHPILKEGEMMLQFLRGRIRIVV